MAADRNMFTDGHVDRSHEVAAALRVEAPAHRVVLPTGVPVWLITQFEHARKALVDPRLSKHAALLDSVIGRHLAEAGQPPDLSGMFAGHMLNSDGEEHARLRGLVAAHFAQRRVDALQPRIERLANDLLDTLPLDEPVDLIDRYAYPLPLTVICELLGVPERDQPQLRKWTAALVTDRQDRTLPASEALTDYLTSLIAQKRDHPEDDVLSALLTATEGEDRLTVEEVISCAFLLIVAGHETTANLIGNAVGDLLREPDRWRYLAQHLELLPDAVEELARHDSPVQLGTHRCTTQPVDFGDIHIPAGQIVLPWLGSANRDPDVFTNADQVDFHRPDVGQHLAFGRGIHYCLGAALARLETQVALRALLRRFPATSLAGPAEQLRRRPDTVIVNGYDSLWVKLAP